MDGLHPQRVQAIRRRPISVYGLRLMNLIIAIYGAGAGADAGAGAGGL